MDNYYVQNRLEFILKTIVEKNSKEVTNGYKENGFYRTTTSLI